METAYTIQPQEKVAGKTAWDQEAPKTKLSTNIFLWASAGVISALVLRLANKRKHSFIGKWVAPLILYGILNKLKNRVKHDLTKRA